MPTAFIAGQLEFPDAIPVDGRTNGTVYFSPSSQSNKLDCVSNGRRNKAGLVERSRAGAEHRGFGLFSSFLLWEFGQEKLKRNHEFHFHLIHITCALHNYDRTASFLEKRTRGEGTDRQQKEERKERLWVWLLEERGTFSCSVSQRWCTLHSIQIMMKRKGKKNIKKKVEEEEREGRKRSIRRREEIVGNEERLRSLTNLTLVACRMSRCNCGRTSVAPRRRVLPLQMWSSGWLPIGAVPQLANCTAPTADGHRPIHSLLANLFFYSNDKPKGSASFFLCVCVSTGLSVDLQARPFLLLTLAVWVIHTSVARSCPPSPIASCELLWPVGLWTQSEADRCTTWLSQ